MSPLEKRLHTQRVKELTFENPPLPDFSRFHDAFRPNRDSGTRDGDLRRAFFMSYKDENCEYIKLNGLRRVIANGREVVSAMFVIPYPPGFPVLVPGQVISEEIMAFMQALDTREIHGYRPELGFRVFTEKALLATAGTTSTAAVTATPEPPAPAEAPANEPAE